jgi:dolichyl-phosphate-mannose-protein mannosyltransferase
VSHRAAGTLPGVSSWLERWNRPVYAIVAVTILAGGIRFAHLSHPSSYVFDEVYYPKAGCILLGWSNKVCTVDSSDEKYWRDQKWDVGSWVHPPLGKWQIALGIKAFGMNSFGWRLSSAVAGTLVVTLTAILAQLLWGSALWTFVVGLLMAVEDLNVVMSRTGLLDIHLTFWIMAGFVLFVLDRRWIERRQAAAAAAAAEPSDDGDPPPPERSTSVPSPVWRPYRFAAGAAFGAACAVKWSGGFALIATWILAYMWETSRRHEGDVTWRQAFGRAFTRESFGIVLAFVVTPLAVYIVTWLPWLYHFGWNWGAWMEDQAATWRFHHSGIQWTALDPKTGQMTPTHPYYARPWKWLPLGRPISFYVQNDGTDTEQILAIGNPFIFWASLFAIPYVAVAWRRARDWRAGFIIVAFFGQYLPWFLPGRPTFFFYVLPMVPFMVLAVTYLARDASDAKIVVREPTGEVAINPTTGEPAVSTRYVFRPFVVAYLIVVVAAFIWFWPILTAGRISDLHLRTIVWFRWWI